MDLEMVFNELSLEKPVADKFQARRMMSQLVGTLIVATKSGVPRILRTGADLNTLELSPQYSISQWRNDTQVDREERQFLRSLINKAPYCADVLAEIQQQFDLAEASFMNRKSAGLRYAAITDALAISLASSSEWKCDRLSLDLEIMDADGNIHPSILEIQHASDRQHIIDRKSWIQQRTNDCIKSGKELWEECHNLFDRLQFCNCVGKQLEDILANDPKLAHIVRVLSILNERCSEWTEGYFSLSGYLDESPESESTMNNSALRLQRTFECPDGEKRVFERHIKLHMLNWRIYFLCIHPGQIIIGYIGSHLSTTKYRT